MAFFYKKHRIQFAKKMSAGDNELFNSLCKANFAKTNNKYLIAWHSHDEIFVLPPNHPINEQCESLFDCSSIDEAIAYIESGEYVCDSSMVLNLFIENPITGKFE